MDDKPALNGRFGASFHAEFAELYAFTLAGHYVSRDFLEAARGMFIAHCELFVKA